MRTLRNSRHDLAGNNFWRVLQLNFLNKVLPLGNYRFGIGLRPALVLLVLHYIGRPVFSLLIRYEPQFHRLYQIMKKRR